MVYTEAQSVIITLKKILSSLKDSVVSIVTKLGSSPGKGKRFVCSPKRPVRLLGPPSLLLKAYRFSFPEVML